MAEYLLALGADLNGTPSWGHDTPLDVAESLDTGREALVTWLRERGHYRDRFGFGAPHEEPGFAVLVRDDAVLHLWAANNEEWRSRGDLTGQPICSGAESFLAGTASCRIEVADIDALFAELKPRGVLHDVSREEVGTTDFGTREFAIWIWMATC